MMQCRAHDLRVVLRDGQWHRDTDLAKQVGHPFGPALFLVRCGTDGEAAWRIDVEARSGPHGGFSYRFMGVDRKPATGRRA